MAISYSNRTAIQQGVVALRMAATATLNANTIALNGVGGSTYGQKIIGGVSQPATGSVSHASRISFNSGTDVVLTNVGFDGSYAGGFGYSTNLGKLIAPSDQSIPNTYSVAETTVGSSSGVANQTMYAPAYTTAFGYTNIVPCQPMLNSGGFLSTFVTTENDPSFKGRVGLYDPSIHAMGSEDKWEGYDATIAGYGSAIAARPYNNSLGNRLLFSGPYIGSGNRPLLIEAGLNGVESGRYYLHLSDPTWDAVLAQPVATRSVYSIWPCNAGWYGVFGINIVTTPTFIVFNEDCTKYWIYVIVANDDAALQAIFTVGWGTGGAERIFVGTPVTSDSGQGDFILSGAVGNPPLLMSNTFSGRSLAPPFPPVIGLPCVPCAPLQYDGNGWRQPFMPPPE